MMLTEIDLKNLKVFMARVNLTGAESLCHAQLMMKLDAMIAAEAAKPKPEEG